MKHKILFSTLPAPYNPDLEKALSTSAFTSSGPSHRKPIHLGREDYLWDEVALLDFDQNPYGTLVVFQPSKQVVTVDGDPQKTLRHWGLLLIGLMASLFAFVTADLLTALSRIQKAAVQIAEGDLNLSLPENRSDEVGNPLLGLERHGRGLKGQGALSLVFLQAKCWLPKCAKAFGRPRSFRTQRRTARMHPALRRAQGF